MIKFSKKKFIEEFIKYGEEDGRDPEKIWNYLIGNGYQPPEDMLVYLVYKGIEMQLHKYDLGYGDPFRKE